VRPADGAEAASAPAAGRAADPAAALGRRRLNFLLPTFGSAGDVHPFIALGITLRSRGHQATLITNPLFQPLIERLGLQFVGLGSAEQARAALADPDIWHPRKGVRQVMRIVAPTVAQLYRIVKSRADR